LRAPDTDLDQIVDIATDGLHLSRLRGFLKVSESRKEVGRLPLDQITGVIVHAHGTTWSTSLLAELADRSVPVVLCGSNHAPRSVLMPLEGHHAQGGRIRAQWHTKRPLMKQAWKQVIIAKVKMQAAALDAMDESGTALRMMIRSIKSGDSTNIEAQAARYYWSRMMGKSFRRDINGSGENAMLNYGYTVLRAATARAVVVAGLHPAIGIHHSSRGNAFALADDLMEPFRPLVDCAVRHIAADNGPKVNTVAKQALARLIATDMPLGAQTTPVSVALTKLATSLGQSFESGKLTLALPCPPDAFTLAGLGR